MSKLSNIAIIDQAQLLKSYEFAIKEKENILVIGPSGAGKTEMGFTACKNANTNCIYWNMSVMERPDIQGLPAIAKDKLTSFFAPQETMPFVGLKNLKQRRALEVIAEQAEDANPELSDFIKEAKTHLKNLDKNRMLEAIKDCHSLFGEKVRNIGVNPSLHGNEDSKNVLLLDEVDKTPPENLQPLLELLLYRTINGKPLDIQSVIMTGNLPDEHTYSDPLSHAITNRAMVFELRPDWKIWLQWAASANIHPVVKGFLSREENAIEMFNKRPGSNDTYTYAYTTPRSWAVFSRVNYKFDKWLEEGRITEDLRNQFNASIIGTEASAKVAVWLKYFRKYDKLIDSVFAGSNEPAPVNEETDAENLTATVVIAMAVANKFTTMAVNSENTNEVQQKAAHVYSWISKNVPKDVKNAAFRASYNKEHFMRHGLEKFSITREMWSDVVESVNAIQSSQKL